jgi:dienelactone hydrolase
MALFRLRFTPGTNKVGVIGFCWGGRYATLAAHDAKPGHSVDAAYACHPFLVSIPEDFDPVTKALSLALGTKDSLLGKKEIGQLQELMDKKTEVPHEIWTYED